MGGAPSSFLSQDTKQKHYEGTGTVSALHSEAGGPGPSIIHHEQQTMNYLPKVGETGTASTFNSNYEQPPFRQSGSVPTDQQRQEMDSCPKDTPLKILDESGAASTCASNYDTSVRPAMLIGLNRKINDALRNAAFIGNLEDVKKSLQEGAEINAIGMWSLDYTAMLAPHLKMLKMTGYSDCCINSSLLCFGLCCVSCCLTCLPCCLASYIQSQCCSTDSDSPLTAQFEQDSILAKVETFSETYRDILQEFNEEELKPEFLRLLDFQDACLAQGTLNNASALHYAAYSGAGAVVSFLIETSADVNLRNSRGQTAMDIAVSRVFPNIMHILLQSGVAEVDHNLLTWAKVHALAEVASILSSIATNTVEAEFLKQGRFYPMFVCKKEDFLAMQRLEKHEIALKNGIVVEIPSDAIVLFFSHRWLAGHKGCEGGPHPDTPQNFKFAAMCAILMYFPRTTHVWVDYVCVPQDNVDNQLLAINSLPYIVRQCSDFVVLQGVSGVTNNENEDEASFKVYNSRGWCRLECLSAAAPSSESEQGHHINTWMCDMSVHTVFPLELSKPSAYDPLANDAVFFEQADRGKIAPTVMSLADKFDSSTDGILQMKENAVKYLPKDLRLKYSTVKYRVDRVVDFTNPDDIDFTSYVGQVSEFFTH